MSNHSAAPDATLTSPRILPDLAPPAASSAVMPGWHIYADFTPPELAQERKARTVRFGVILAIILVAALVAGGFVYARGEASQAQAAIEAEDAISAQLRTQQQELSSATQLEATVTSARQRLATLLASDVDVDSLLGAIWTALPEQMTISQISVTIPEQFSDSSGGTARGNGAAALDPSQAAHIGTVAIAGTGTVIDDVPAFIDNLGAIDGVFAPFPTSNQQTDEGTSYSLQFTLTDTLLTGRYAVEEGN